MGRFINADAFASTGQDLLGQNMFTYCANIPTSRADSSGYRHEAVCEFFGGSVAFSTATFDPNGSFSAGHKNWDFPDLSSFALVREVIPISGGVKIAEFLTGGFDAYSIGDGGFTLLSFDLSIISFDAVKGNYSLSPVDLGNASLSFGLAGMPYATAMVSLWSPSLSINGFGKTFTLSLHVGALGFEFKPQATNFKVGFAKGIGFSFELS